MANEKRVRRNLQSGTLGAALGGLTTDTTITFAAAPALPTLAADQHAALILDGKEIVYLTAYTAGATTGTIARAQEDTAVAAHANGAKWHHGPTRRDQAAGRVAFIRRTAGHYALNPASTTTWYDLDTGLDLVLPAWEGDMVSVGFSARWEAVAVWGFLDVASIVSAARQGWWGGDGGAANAGITAWTGPSNTAVQVPVGGPVMKRLVAADVAAGTVTMRLVYRTSGAKTLYANADNALHFWAVNHGPQEA